MKNLTKILMVIGFVVSAISMVMNIINDKEWIWQLISMLWITAAFFNEKTADRYRSIIDKMSKK